MHMCLGLIWKKLNDNKYKSINDAADDVRLLQSSYSLVQTNDGDYSGQVIWGECEIIERSAHLMVEYFDVKFEELCKQYAVAVKSSIPSGSNDDAASTTWPPASEKSKNSEHDESEHDDAAPSTGAQMLRKNFSNLVEEKEMRTRSYGYGLTYTDEEYEILAEVLRKTSTMVHLVLGCATILRNDKFRIALVQNRTITRLYVGNGLSLGKNFNINDATALAAVIKENKTLQTIELGGRIGDLGAKVVAKALMTNSSLKRLDLGDDAGKQPCGRISDEGAKAIAKALTVNTALQEIDLSYNIIESEGGTALAKALKKNKTLLSINLRKNKLGDVGVEAIAGALKENTTLQKLNLASNQICDHGGQLLLEAVRKNLRSSLQSVKLGNNLRLGRETYDRIVSLIENPDTVELRKTIVHLRKKNKKLRVENGKLLSENKDEGTASTETEAEDSRQDVAQLQDTLPPIHVQDPKFHKRLQFIEKYRLQALGVNIDSHRRGVITVSSTPRTALEVLRSNQQRRQLAEKDEEIASLKAIMKKIGNMVNGKDEDAIEIGRSTDKGKKLQSAIDEQKQEIESLKEKLKNSRPIDKVDLTSSSDGDSVVEDRPCKRRRTKSNLAIALEQSHQMVKVKQEANQRAATAQADLEVARREKQDVEEDLEDANILVTQQAVATDVWQGRFDELFELARAAGVDGRRLSEIRYRPLSNGV
eukprot:scaffold13462_cov105-Skeletonema_dohrnii-CCMP3373.AAC.5